jgi:hypothetical protein
VRAGAYPAGPSLGAFYAEADALHLRMNGRFNSVLRLDLLNSPDHTA